MRCPSPSRAALSTVSRTASTPARCPSTRGRPRFLAQRPLPSMMMATCGRQAGEVDLRQQGGFRRARFGEKARRRHNPKSYHSDCVSPAGPSASSTRSRQRPCGRRRRPGLAAPPPGEERAPGRGRAGAGGDLELGADESAHHAAQEPFAADPEDELGALLLPARGVDPADRRLRRGAGEHEGREVVLAGQQACRGGEQRRVESRRRRDGEGGARRRDHPPAVEPVAVELGDGVPAGVVSLGRHARREHPDVGGQEVIGAVDEPLHGKVATESQGDELPVGVHAGVGAAGADGTNGLAGQRGERLLEHLLHGEGVRLALPAGVAGADVGEREADVHGGRCGRYHEWRGSGESG